MAMGKCRECSSDVSDLAKTCPKCGVAEPVPAPKKTFKWAEIFIKALIFGAVVVAFKIITGRH